MEVLHLAFEVDPKVHKQQADARTGQLTWVLKLQGLIAVF